MRAVHGGAGGGDIADDGEGDRQGNQREGEGTAVAAGWFMRRDLRKRHPALRESERLLLLEPTGFRISAERLRKPYVNEFAALILNFRGIHLNALVEIAGREGGLHVE